ncbi:MAG: DNA polymerase Y family protein [Thermomicrobiales bacterium]
MTIACIAVPHFALRVALLDRPELDGAPLILGPPAGGRPLVQDATPEAAARGVRAGITLREAAALCPDAMILTPHPVREAATATRIADDLAVFSPLVEADARHAGHWHVDLRGSERLLGPPHAAAERLLEGLPPLLRPRAGVAPGKFPARVAAANARPGAALFIEARDVAAALAPAPVTLLPLPPETIRRMERLGLRTLGDLAALTVPAVQARFGPEGRAARELALGIDPDPVRPAPIPEIISERITLPAPATSREALMAGIQRLALAAFERPALRDRFVRQARLLALLEGGGSWDLLATLREPGGYERVVKALEYRLDGAALPGPIERLGLDLISPVDISGRQELLPGFRARKPRELVEAARQLKQRFGTTGLYRVVEVEPWSRIPERRQALIAYDL